MKMNINKVNSNLDTVEHQLSRKFSQCFIVQESFLFCFFFAGIRRESMWDRNLDICEKGSMIISYYRPLQPVLLKISSQPQFFPEVFLLPTSTAMNEWMKAPYGHLSSSMYVGLLGFRMDPSIWVRLTFLFWSRWKKKSNRATAAFLASSAFSHPNSFPFPSFFPLWFVCQLSWKRMLAHDFAPLWQNEAKPEVMSQDSLTPRELRASRKAQTSCPRVISKCTVSPGGPRHIRPPARLQPICARPEHLVCHGPEPLSWLWTISTFDLRYCGRHIKHF